MDINNILFLVIAIAFWGTVIFFFSKFLIWVAVKFAQFVDYVDDWVRGRK